MILLYREYFYITDEYFPTTWIANLAKTNLSDNARSDMGSTICPNILFIKKVSKPSKQVF